MPTGWRSQYLRYREFYLNIVEIYKRRPDLKMFAETILSITAIIIFIVFALKPTTLTIIELTKDIRGKKETVAKLETKLANLDTASVVLTQISSRLPVISSSIPSLPEPDSYTKQVELLATKNSVSILSISMNEVALIGTSSKKPEKGIKTLPTPAKELPVTITVNGAYQNLLNFLKDMENTRRPIKVDNFAINTSTSDSGVRIVLIITGRLPYLPDDER